MLQTTEAFDKNGEEPGSRRGARGEVFDGGNTPEDMRWPRHRGRGHQCQTVAASPQWPFGQAIRPTRELPDFSVSIVASRSDSALMSIKRIFTAGSSRGQLC